MVTEMLSNLSGTVKEVDNIYYLQTTENEEVNGRDARLYTVIHKCIDNIIIIYDMDTLLNMIIYNEYLNNIIYKHFYFLLPALLYL